MDSGSVNGYSSLQTKRGVKTMITVESTPDMAKRVYATMRQNLAVVRRRLQRPLTLADKVLLGHLCNPHAQDLEQGRSYLLLRPDRVLFQDVLGQSAILQFMQTKLKRVALPTTIHCDHLVQAQTGGAADLRAAIDENKEVFDFLRSAAAKYGLGFWEPGAGIIHQVVLENYAFPGELIVGTDSHTPNAGGLGACAVGVGGADAVDVISGLPWEVLHPRHIAVYLTGRLNGWAAPKDPVCRRPAYGFGRHERDCRIYRPRHTQHKCDRQGYHYQYGCRARSHDLYVSRR
jgi:aconitate hydratase A / 2-methylisocitrate dehydratase